MKSRTVTLTLLLVISLILISCQKRDEKVLEEKKLIVVTSLFPLYDFAKNIAQQKADVTLLPSPGVEPHNFELKPSDILRIHKSDIFIYTGRSMEPWVEDIIKGIGDPRPLIIDSSKGIVFTEQIDENGSEYEYGYGKIDPHIWLDLSNAQKMLDNILEGLIKKSPENKDFFLNNYMEYKMRLNELDERFRDTLTTCKKDLIIHGGHFAFSYLSTRYRLKYRSAYRGFSPDAEPTPRNLMELTKLLKDHNIKFIFYEELITPKVSEVIARETGAKLLLLHGAHNITKEEFDRGVTFIALMKQNLENLKIGLECQ